MTTWGGSGRRDNLSDWAAALTYYGILSIFPALLALVSILGLFGSSTTQPLIDNLNTVVPGPARQILTTFLHETQRNTGGAVLALIGGVAVALWSASGYVAAFVRAANLAYDVGEWRPAWKTLPLRLAGHRGPGGAAGHQLGLRGVHREPGQQGG